MATTTLLSRRDFRLFWGGQFVSDLGGQLTAVALPCAVVMLLHATPMQVGTLQAVQWGIVPLLAMAIGVIVDRVRRRRLMIAANVVRTVALASLPIVAALHALTLAHVFVAAALAAGAAVVFDTAYQAFLPTLTGREHLVEGNAKMTMGASAAEVTGSALSGALVGAIGAPVAIALNVAAYIGATCALLRLRTPEPVTSPDPDASFRRELREGLRVVFREPALRGIALASGVHHLGEGVAQAVFFLYLFHTLHLTPLALGIALGLANVGMLGAAFAGRIAAALGTRLTLFAGLTCGAVGFLVLPLVGDFAPLAALLVSRLLITAGAPVFDITQQTLRVALVPAPLHGRMNATMRTLVWGGLPVGAFLGGVLGSTIGLGPTMLAGGAIALAGAACVWLMPRLEDERPDYVRLRRAYEIA